MMGNCKDCNRWEQWEEDADIQRSGACQLATDNRIAVSHGYYGDITRKSVKMYASMGEFITLPDFGCNQFEAKEGAT